MAPIRPHERNTASLATASLHRVGARYRFGGLLVGFLVVLATVALSAGLGAAGPHPYGGTAKVPLPLAATVALGDGGAAPGASLPGIASLAVSAVGSGTPGQPTRAGNPLRPTAPYGTAQAVPPPRATPVSSVAPEEGMDSRLLAGAAPQGQIIGQSVQGRPILAYRIGNGPLKVVLVGDIHGAFEANTHVLVQQLLSHFLDHSEEVPSNVSLWLVPTMNPDGLATDHRWNANNVDLNRNADTDLDGCAANDWSPDTEGQEGSHPGAGGAYPFSEPETRAMRDFLRDAWVAVFYHSAAESIFADTCRRHAPSGHLAQVLANSTGYQLPEQGWQGYPVTGDLADYLAGEGLAAVTVELSNHQDPDLYRNLAGVHAVLSAADEIVSMEATNVRARYVWLDEGNTAEWRYAAGSFLHPIALEQIGTRIYLLDGGRVLALDLVTQASGLRTPAALRVLLAPGDEVDAGPAEDRSLGGGGTATAGRVRVLEPLDLAADGSSLLVLDRATDVYRYDPSGDRWAMERLDRPSRDTSDHYFVALATPDRAASGSDPTLSAAATSSPGYLLETTHEVVWGFPAGQAATSSKMGASWAKLPLARDVDLSAFGTGIYVLTRAMNTPLGSLWLYRDGRQVREFRPNVQIMHPRQVVATAKAVYVLDRAGRRLLALDRSTGALLTLYQFVDRREVSAFWADPSGERLLLAGRDRLFLYGNWQAAAASGGQGAGLSPSNVGVESIPTAADGRMVLEGPQPHDLLLLERLRGLLMPIEGATVTQRDFQMPGAPRHYREGIHEGLDFYSGTVGVAVNRQTPVRAVADGVVIRALVDYQPLTAAQSQAWAAEVESLGYTPTDVLDGYRGMQIWIDHGGGLVSRYAHLGSIAPGVVEGVRVKGGQPIATVGNSGTPSSVWSTTEEVHLHLELWLQALPVRPGGDGLPALQSAGVIPAPEGGSVGAASGHHIGQFLRPIEAREWLERILR